MEDKHTSTVDGAAAHAKGMAEDERYDDVFNEYEETEEDEDPCGCSDPGCPCSGYKKGGL